MWTPTIKNVNRSDERVRVDVEFSNGQTSFQRTFMFNGNVSKEQVWGNIKEINDIVNKGDSLIKELSDLPIGDGEVVEPVLSADEVAKRAYIQTLNKFDSAKRAIETGALAADDPIVATLKAKLATDFKEEYIGII